MRTLLAAANCVLYFLAYNTFCIPTTNYHHFLFSITPRPFMTKHNHINYISSATVTQAQKHTQSYSFSVRSQSSPKDFEQSISINFCDKYHDPRCLFLFFPWLHATFFSFIPYSNTTQILTADPEKMDSDEASNHKNWLPSCDGRMSPS